MTESTGNIFISFLREIDILLHRESLVQNNWWYTKLFIKLRYC